MLVWRGFDGMKYSTYPWSQDSVRLVTAGLVLRCFPPMMNPPVLSSEILFFAHSAAESWATAPLVTTTSKRAPADRIQARDLVLLFIILLPTKFVSLLTSDHFAARRPEWYALRHPFLSSYLSTGPFG